MWSGEKYKYSFAHSFEVAKYRQGQSHAYMDRFFYMEFQGLVLFELCELSRFGFRAVFKSPPIMAVVVEQSRFDVKKLWKNEESIFGPYILAIVMLLLVM